MMRKTIVVLSALALLALLATQAFATEITIRGKLKRTVEAGGWVVVSDKDKYLILNAKKFASEGWFTEGTEVEAAGEIKTGVVTIFMEGTPFEARSMRPFEPGGSDAAGATGSGMTRVMVTGESILQARPDTALLMISVVTQGKRALDAQQENANRTDAVVRALKAAAGAGAEIKTGGYSVQPQRVFKENQPPTITGYEARNTVTLGMSDLTKVGSVIDAAVQSGANDIDSVSFTLRQDRPARDQALAAATRNAVSKAQVIAAALGGKVVRVVEVQEEGFVRPRPLETANGGLRLMQATTPIEVGSLDITARVQLIAEIEK
ncbi:MAG: hypothetical protein JWM21_492 [Acidobacteria bacterium]|nr:hypothetical protein [Acidobacteriota bacterium]